jgi:DNA-binding CsgD family transcriptional regulator
MIALRLRNYFQQSLLESYLASNGFTILSINGVYCPDSSIYTLPTVIITDEPDVGSVAIQQSRLIWLVDCEAALPELIPVGVNGLLCSASHVDELLNCLQQVQDGKRYVSTQLLPLLMGRREPTDEMKAIGTLTRREREVFDLLVQGLSSSQIADKLFRSINTVENHRASIQRKLGLAGRYSLMRYTTLAAGKSQK